MPDFNDEVITPVELVGEEDGDVEFVARVFGAGMRNESFAAGSLTNESSFLFELLEGELHGLSADTQ